jgi:hypothetical protein
MDDEQESAGDQTIAEFHLCPGCNYYQLTILFGAKDECIYCQQRKQFLE